MAILNISELEQVEKFRQLQLTLRDRWKTIESFDNSEAEILIISSLSIDQRELQRSKGANIMKKDYYFL